MKSPYDRFMEEYVATTVPADNKKGFRVQYVYYAPWYIWFLPEKELKKEKIAMAARAAVCTALYVLTVCMHSRLNALALVAVAAIILLMTLIVMLFGIGQFCFAPYRTTKGNFVSVNRRLRLYPLINTAAAIFASGSCIYYMAVYSWSWQGCVLAIFYGLEAVFAYRVRRCFVRIPATTELNDFLRKH